MTGLSQEPLLARVCQNGVAPDAASDSQASPSKPDTGLDNKPEVTSLHTATNEF
jgi:hypothetical protein